MTGEILNRFTRQQFQQVAFLLVLPAVNWIFVVSTLYDLGSGSLSTAGRVAIRLWLLFGLSFLALRLLQRFAPRAFAEDHFWRQLVIHIAVVVAVALAVSPWFAQSVTPVQANSMVMPRIFLMLEIVVYVTVSWILRQQSQNFATADRLREAQLHLLKSQSNPHFLFNTLNLISDEIETDPKKARETVFNLADLLRSNIRLAERRTISVSEELRLVELYLALQQSRFRDRLTVSVAVDPATADLQIPALLLQPVIENTIKWAVAPYATAATVEVITKLQGDRWSVLVNDSGPTFDDTAIVEGDGFRILRKTLDLQYQNNYELSLQSTHEGGRFKLRLPVTLERRNHA